MRIFSLGTVLFFSISSWSGDYGKYLMPLLMSFPITEAIDPSDQWTYNNAIAQSVLGLIGVGVIGITFGWGHKYWRKTERDKQKILQEHIDDLEEINFRRRQTWECIQRTEVRFKQMLYDNN